MAWSAPESGILRKNVPTGNLEDLLVFGYACKVFRDDEKALYIDQGKHLIPWMGDVKLKIDRYDCRGHLSDINKYEASREGYDAMRWLGLNDKERQLEELCDKERYYSLEINEEEEEMYKEEEQKRQKTNAIAYSYDVPTDPDAKSTEEANALKAEDIDEEYNPSPILDVPVDIDIPKTVKENARIEKTALFVCRQGLQMEILIKAKQGNNPQFSFLNQGDKLNKYYRHVLAAFKSGIYQGHQTLNTPRTDSADSQEQDANSHYLHPSLLSANALQPETTTTPVTLPQVPYKPSVNCAYSQLVNRIQGNQYDAQEMAAEESVADPAPDYSQMTPEQQQQYYHYYYAQQYYEYCKQLALYQQGQATNPGQFVPPTDFEKLDPSMQAYIHQMAYAQYVQHFQQQVPNNSYAQIVSNLNKEGNPYTAQVPQLPQNLAPPTEESKEQQELQNKPIEAIVKKPLLSLAAYGSGSDTEDESSNQEEQQENDFKMPTGEIQAVIDKMAVYVSKNGDQFEGIVKAKGDPRFSFLNDDHEFNAYYRNKIKELKDVKIESLKEKTSKNKETKESDAKPTKKEKKVIAPVSFSIKKTKEDQPKEIKSALPVEESDEEEPVEELSTTAPTPTSTAAVIPKAPESFQMKTHLVTKVITSNEHGNDDNAKKFTTIIIDENIKERKIDEIFCEKVSESRRNSKSSSNGKSCDSSPKKNGILDGDDPILEMIELTEEVEDKQNTTKMENQLTKDKHTASSAFEKSYSASRDKALQLERRRRAAAFLKLKSVGSNPHGGKDDVDDEMPKSPALSRRDSVEVILDSSDEKYHHTKKERYVTLSNRSDNNRSKSKSPVKKYNKERSCRSKYRSSSRDIRRERSKSSESEGSRSRDRERRKERCKRKKSKKDRRSSVEEGEYVNKKNGDDKEKDKRSYKRKHSRSKKKSKKHRKRSESDSLADSDR